MRVLNQMKREYKPPRPEFPEGYSRVYVMPEDEQPEGGLWTEAHLKRLLSKLEASSWRDEPYVPPPPKQPSFAARRGYSSAEGSSNGNQNRPNPERSNRGSHGDDRCYGRPHHQYQNPSFRLWNSTSAYQGNGTQGGTSSHHRWGEQSSWRSPGRPSEAESYGPPNAAANPLAVYPASGPEHGTAQWRPPYRPRDAAFEYGQPNYGSYRGGRGMAGNHTTGSGQAQYLQYERPVQTPCNHNNASGLPSFETTAAQLEVPLPTSSVEDVYTATP